MEVFSGILRRKAANVASMLTRSQAAGFSTESLKVVHDVAKKQFYINLANEFATIDYSQQGDKITLLETEVPPLFRGKGVGKLLAAEAFNFALEKNLSCAVQCEFLQNYYEVNKDKLKGLNAYNI